MWKNFCVEFRKVMLRESREKILSLKDPFATKPKKVKGEENTFRLRVGNRILFFIDEEQKIVTVSKVDKRERVYDQL